MKNQKGFVAPLLLIVLLIVFGGGMYAYLQTNKEQKAEGVNTSPAEASSTSTANTPITTQEVNATTPGWKIYTNYQHGYSIEYPESVKVVLVGDAIERSVNDRLSSTTRWYASTCVYLDGNDWQIGILADGQFSQAPCGPTGTSATNHPQNDTLTINSKTFSITGRMEPNRTDAQFDFTLNDHIGVTYGTHEPYEVVSGPGLTQQEYETLLSVIHEVLSTLKPIPNFVPTQPPEDPLRLRG